MQQTTTLTHHSSHVSEASTATKPTRFVQWSAVVIAAGFTLFCAAIMLTGADALALPVIFTLWAAVVVGAVATYEVGSHRHRELTNAEKMTAAGPSRRMRRWMDSSSH